MTRCLPVLLLLLVCLPAQADELRLFELQHRSAEELIPILRPLLAPDTGLSGSGYTLILRAAPHELEVISTLIPQLDTPLAQLLITVRQDREVQRRQEGLSLHGTPDAPSARFQADRLAQQNQHDQQLRVIEGRWASIRTGQAVPLIVQTERHNARGRSERQAIEYRDIDTGFEVRPRISGDRVTLEIRPFFARPAAGGGGVIEQQNVITTVSGRLGEWVEIAGAVQDQQDSGSGTVYITREHQHLLQDVRLKVERLP